MSWMPWIWRTQIFHKKTWYGSSQVMSFFRFSCYSCSWRDTWVKTGSRFEAKSIAISKSASSSAHCLNHHDKPVLDFSLTPLPPTIYSFNVGHGLRYLVCLYWTGFLGLHYTWVKAGLRGLPISELRASAVKLRAQLILLEDFHSQAILKFHHISSLG